MDVRRFSGTIRFLSQLARHSALRPRPLSLSQRLAMLPMKGAPVARPVAIHWNHHHVPFIEAESDIDLAASLGVVHAHLRLGQMEMMRRLSQGRIAEMLGGIGIGIDRLIRTFEIGRAVPAIRAMLPAETSDWIAGFVGGINHVITRSEHLPSEFAIFGLSRELWSIEDVLTLGRLVSADINWLVWLRLMKFRTGRDWTSLWRTLLRADALSACSEKHSEAAVEALGLAAVRSGSNSFAVAAHRSRSGGALIASDPHLAITLPNSWLIAGYRSPSHHAVGLMIPGIPFIGIGRSPNLAWGGASLHAASSDLVAIPPGSETTTHFEILGVRGEADRVITIRRSEWGPLVSGLRPFRRGLSGDVALRWMGHLSSDEFSAMLAIGRARDFEEAKRALAGYALPGLEMNFASASGGIAQFTAVRVPRRCEIEPPDIVSATANGWEQIAGVADFPARVDPDCGVVIAANTRPDWNQPVIGFLFSPPARRDRIATLLGATPDIDLDELKRIQRDVHRTSAIAERDSLLCWIADAKLEEPRDLAARIAEWSGDYGVDSAGAFAFELVVYHLASRLVPKRKRRAYSAAWGARELIWSEICAADPFRRAAALRRALRSAAGDFGRGATWGSRHRLRIAHPLAAVPLIGRRFRGVDLPAAGTSDTVMKTAHALTNRRHRARYGSVARHMSDMADPDANWFALLGGNDGWLESDTTLDQLKLWQKSEYIRVPLRPETAHTAFPHKTILTP